MQKTADFKIKYQQIQQKTNELSLTHLCSQIKCRYLSKKWDCQDSDKSYGFIFFSEADKMKSSSWKCQN